MSIERGKFISIHGIDGTGKTETARAVQREVVRRGYEAVNYDDHQARKANPHREKKEALDARGSVEDRLTAHLESTMYHSDQIDSLLAQGYHVVKSRYLDDVMANFAHLGVSQDYMDTIVRKFPVVQPDLKVILTVEEPERIRRIQNRQDATEVDKEEKKTGSHLLFLEEYLKNITSQSDGVARLSLDTGSLDSNQVARSIVDHLLTRS